MKRNLKSILKYFIFILVTVLVTIVVFKLSKHLDQNFDNELQLMATGIIQKQLYSNETDKIDWHDWQLINKEKLQTGKIVFYIFLWFL